jgi:hypothetical protein
VARAIEVHGAETTRTTGILKQTWKPNMTSPYLLLPRRSIGEAIRQIGLKKRASILTMAGAVVRFQDPQHNSADILTRPGRGDRALPGFDQNHLKSA